MIRALPSFRVRRLPAIAAVVVLLAAAVGAWAYFTSTGTGTASASVGSINPPSNVTAQQTGANVVISWNAATLSSGGSLQGYRVKRSDNTTICGSPTLVTSLSCTDTSVASGTYTYAVTAVYNSFTASATSNSITILTVPSIIAKPSNPSATSAPSFSFSGGGGSGYQCQLDGGSFTSCSSPNPYSGLADGSHTFKVHAVQSSSTGPDATYTWTIDTSAPSITAKPSNPSANASPSFSFSHTQAAYTFKCQLDGGGFSACTSPKPYSGLADGSHTFQVEGVSADGATTSVASYTWLVDTTAPVTSIAITPASPNGSNGWYKTTAPTFTLSATDGGSGVASTFYKIDSGSTQTYASAVTIPEGEHTISYWSTDNAGNTETTHTTAKIKVDTTTPTTPTLAFSGLSSNAFYSSGQNTLYFRPAAGGAYTVTASSTDSVSGIASYTFSSLSSNNFTGTQTGGQDAYTFGASAIQPGSNPTVLATSNSGTNSANASYNLISDTTAPSGGSVSVPARVHAASVAVTFSPGTDSGSGINGAAGQLLRAEATYTASSDTCGAFGSFANDSAAGKSSPATDTVATGKCYEYEYSVADNVGNATTYGPSGVLRVNTAGPSLTGISSTNGNGILEPGDVLTLTFSDTINAASIPSTGIVKQAKSGVGAAATVAVTGLTGGTEGWSTGVSAGYQEKQSSVEYNETASASGSTVTVTVGSKVKGSGTIAGATGTVTGTVNTGVSDVFGNTASTGTFSISAKFW
jgi:large repetitive protein